MRDGSVRTIFRRVDRARRYLHIIISATLIAAATLLAYSADQTASRGDLWRAESQKAAAAAGAANIAERRDALAKLRNDFPNNSRVLRNLALAELQSGHAEAARALLRNYAAMGTAIISGTPIYNALAPSGILASLPELKQNQSPVSMGNKLFALPDSDLIAEDVAFDAAKREFFVTSVHKRKIVGCNYSGRCRDVINGTPEAPLDGMFAIHLDPARNLLWATTAGLEMQEGFKPERKGHSALLKFDLNTFRLLERYKPGDGKEHALGDMTIARNGDVFVSDGESGDVYVMRHDGTQLEQLASSALFISPQTPALNADESLLYVPDYLEGIAVINLKTRAVRWITSTSPQALEGIDGLYWTRAGLIAVQNGTMPERIAHFRLQGDTVIDSFSPLESNFPDLGDPTHGVLVGDDFYFIVNSGWDRVSDNGTLAPGNPPEIWKLHLKH